MSTQSPETFNQESAHDGTIEIRLSEVLSALSYALDITEGQPEGHAVRTCFVGMTLAAHLGLDAEQRSALFYSLLLKDLGCSSNASKTADLFGANDHGVKQRLKTVQWSSLLHSAFYVLRSAGEGRSIFTKLKQSVLLGLKGQSVARQLIQLRCERGADIARQLGFPDVTARAILELDEHWDGRGYPAGLRAEQISLLGRILNFAQTIDVFFQAGGQRAVRRVVRRRRGAWFDPALCDLFQAHIANNAAFWQQLASPDLIQEVGQFEPQERVLHASQDRLDEIAAAFARVIDAKSPYTARHSARVTEIVLGMAGEIGIPAAQRRDLSRAALLHDIGKLGVSNLILDKPGKLTPEEWAQMRLHPDYSYRILERVNGFSQLADLAAAHHERLDGRGYFRQLSDASLSTSARLLAVADQYEALTAQRPYRAALSSQKALHILSEELGTGIDPLAFAALRSLVEKGQAPPPTEPHGELTSA